MSSKIKWIAKRNDEIPPRPPTINVAGLLFERNEFLQESTFSPLVQEHSLEHKKATLIGGGAGGVSPLRFAIHFIFEDTGIEILVVHHVLETLSNIFVVEHFLVLGTIINARS